MPTRRGRPHQLAVRALAIQLYRDGMTQNDVAAKLDISPHAVAARARDAGLPIADVPGRFINADQAATIANSYVDGESLSELAEAFGASTHTIRRCLNDHDVPTRPLRDAYSDDFRNQVVNDYLAGASLRTLASQYNISRSTVRRWVLDAGHETRPSSQPARQFPTELLDAYRNGESIASIARRTTWAKSTIRERLHNADIEIRPAQWRHDNYQMTRIDPPAPP